MSTSATVSAEALSSSSKYSRHELEEMMRRWADANRRAEETGDWRSTLGAHYTDDAEYRWDVGPDETFIARGVQEIRDIALGYQMEGFKGWKYPYDRVLVDDVKGEVVAFWRQVAPYRRADGSAYEVAGVGGSWFRYGGDFKWSRQQDFFDFGCVMALFEELAADGHLNATIKKKIRQKVAGTAPLPGHAVRHRASLVKRLRGKLSLARIALVGR
jgi:hypothetical protein